MIFTNSVRFNIPCLLFFIKVVPKLTRYHMPRIKMPLPIALPCQTPVHVYTTRVCVCVCAHVNTQGFILVINGIIIYTLFRALLLSLNNLHFFLAMQSGLFHPTNGLHYILYNHYIIIIPLVKATWVAPYFFILHVVPPCPYILECVYEYFCRKV